ncbi:MAG: hypothetical protein Ct9H300mP6_01280 [Gammaproteobacteria bacterium]|nr:MAG: hypothetical protein Ct9H300mP6_01280 [Gammaproteobacteria bacterium]
MMEQYPQKSQRYTQSTKDGNFSVDDLIEDQGLQQITDEDQIKSVF